MTAISHDQFERIAARANDPRRRTFMSGIEADAEPLDFAQLTEDFRRHGAPAAKGLLDLAGQLEGLMDSFDGAIAMGPDGPMRFGGKAPSLELPPPPSQALLQAVEAQIGRTLPDELHQLYAIGDGGFGPGNGLFPILELGRRYAELTGEPFGPLGQAWPKNLLPILEEEPVLVCLDLDGGAIFAWDPEEIEDQESEEDWQRSFKWEHASLAVLMEAWLKSPIFGE